MQILAIAKGQPAVAVLSTLGLLPRLAPGQPYMFRGHPDESDWVFCYREGANALAVIVECTEDEARQAVTDVSEICFGPGGADVHTIFSCPPPECVAAN